MTGFVSKSEIFIRYNNAGYAPDSRKEFIILSDEDLSNQTYSLFNSPELTEHPLPKNSSRVSLHSPFPYNYTINLSYLTALGKYKIRIKETEITFIIKENPYSFLVSNVLRYYRVQRSFSKDALDHKISHRGDKRCEIHRRKDNKNNQWSMIDEFPKKMNLTGGWYDAGDYIKFTLTTAHSAYNMLTAYEINPDLFQEKKYSQTELNDLLDEASWGLDFLIKVSEDEDEFIIQVGGFKDHQEKDRLPEYDELNGFRESYSAFSATQMGFTSATLALGAQLFKGKDDERAKLYAERAKRIYKRAQYIENCAWVKQGWETFYKDETPFDNLLLASIELFKLTKDEKYKSDASLFMHKAGRSYWASWGNINPMAHVKAKHFLDLDDNYGEQDLASFKETALSSGNIWHVPHKYTWGSLYSFMAVANASALQSIYEKDTTYSLNFHSTLNYSLGKNNWGMCFYASEEIPNSVENIYSQVYKLQPKLFPPGAVAEGPGDRSTHDQLKKYFGIPKVNPFDKFNSSATVFYDYDTDFQTMETTIVGQGAGLLLIALADKLL